MSQPAGTVVVAMSGGVDSSVAAGILKEQGWDVIGVTMRIWPCEDLEGQAEAPRGCCGPTAVADARRVAAQLRIPHYVFDLRDVFQREVIDPFCEEYAAGRTPNPCIRCNRYVKFGALAERADKAGADHIATGHYARIEHNETAERWLIRTGIDAAKDQSYALYSLEQSQLERAVMPIGALSKNEVRERARGLGLPVAEKLESQEICFIVDDDYPAYVSRLLPSTAAPGPIVDSAGRRVGTHRGVAFYTIGQRKGLGVSGTPEALYVVDIDAQENTVVVGAERELYRTHVTAGAANYVARPSLTDSVRLAGKIRYRMPAQPCSVKGEGRVLEAEFDAPQRAVTPGQAAVFYDGDTVMCGGVIERRAR
jgi:tRNA-specific 2-thiouridylase